MKDILMRKSDGKYCISSDSLSVADFGDTEEEAKKNFKIAVNLMLDSKLEEVECMR